MSGKPKKSRIATNTAESVTLSLNERILKECYDFYVDPKTGLIKFASELGLDFLAPRKKITVLLIGNHSAGKSSFVNWYVEEHILKTGVAIETQGFTFVTSGKKRETLTGNATIHLYPHFKPLTEIKGLLDYVTTEISTSKQKKFSLVTFIDTPGLVDGEMNYPFDVEKGLKFLGNLSDLIFVFFDPIGQALRKRTLNVVEALTTKHHEKFKLYLSKADEAGNEADRQKVLMQIVQELCRRPALNRAGFDLSTIYIPNPNKPSRCVNQIEDVCKHIEKTINRTIQNSLNNLETDCTKLEKAINDVLIKDEKSKSENLRSEFKGLVCGFIGVALPLFLFCSYFVSSAPSTSLEKIFGESSAEVLKIYVKSLGVAWMYLPENIRFFVVCLITVLSLSLLVFSYFFFRLRPALNRKQRKSLLETKQYVSEVIKNRKNQLYNEYLSQSVAEHEL